MTFALEAAGLGRRYGKTWALQGFEASLLLVLAIALMAFTIWWIRYRIR